METINEINQYTKMFLIWLLFCQVWLIISVFFCSFLPSSNFLCDCFVVLMEEGGWEIDPIGYINVYRRRSVVVWRKFFNASSYLEIFTHNLWCVEPGGKTMRSFYLIKEDPREGCFHFLFSGLWKVFQFPSLWFGKRVPFCTTQLQKILCNRWVAPWGGSVGP